MSTGDLRRRFASTLGFSLDPFQLDSLDVIDSGEHVLVAAPTGSGKTVVGLYALDRVLARGERGFYTTPIKALSNQKFHELCARHGPDSVGLLTGDASIRPTAPIVVMTTEVLRNMIYEGSDRLDALGVVVIDEVHYLQDRFRGPVWEEVIVHLDRAVPLVCLSATVSNATEIGDWLSHVRGPTAVIVHDHRPVPLEHRYAVLDRRTDQVRLLGLLSGADLAPEIAHLAADRSSGRSAGRRPSGRLAAPRRPELVDALADEDLLPAIYFLFSRAACADSARLLGDRGHSFNSPDASRRVRELADAHVAELSDDDLDALGYAGFRSRLERGIGAHHAGLVPPFKEAVEACFTEGLVAVVFATETLALGINMPARSVVVERLTKFNGERRVPLTPGEFTQLSGRAGRRGIDRQGTAVIVHSPWTPPEQAARLAASREYRLVSAFRPTYNMAANLVRRHERTEAERLLGLSLAQFQSDRAVVSVHRRMDDLEARLARRRVDAECERGDVQAWVAHSAPRGRPSGIDPATLARLQPGQVIALPEGRPGVVIAVTERRNGTVRATAIASGGRRVQLTPDMFSTEPSVLGRLELPAPYQPTSKSFQREVGRALRAAREALTRSAPPASSNEPSAVGECPDLDRHLAALREVLRLERRLDGLRADAAGRAGAITEEFHRILDLLGEWGYVDGWALTHSGELLAGVYHESDLLVSESLRSGVLDGLTPPQMASVLSALSYERRNDEPAPVWYPDGVVAQRVDHLEHIAASLRSAEEARALPQTRPPDGGLIPVVHAWASGHDLDDVLSGGRDPMEPGDFVRQLRQLIDLTRQVAELAPSGDARNAAAAAVGVLDRGLVAASAR